MPKVLVTVAPLKPVADALLKGITHSSVLPLPGQDTHHMVLSPRQSKALAEAEIIIVPDRKLSSVVNELATRREKQGALVIALTELPGADPLPYETTQPWMGPTATKKKPKATGTDPHIWLDPLRMADIAMPLADAIAEKAPSLRAQLRGNARAWQQHVVMQLDPELRKVLGSVEMKQRFNSRPYIPFITSHSAYQYFFTRYGVENSGALSLLPEDATGARTQHEVMKRAGEVTIGCVVAEQDTPMVRRVATASTAKIVRLNPEMVPVNGPSLDVLKDGYDRLLYVTAKTFASCL